ncbi:MAG: hypothetical protein C0405_15160 [Desulfovibrio sp.]|nr:hypothetical protein [Desulfovibrio sp.]
MEDPDFFPASVLVVGGLGRMGSWLAARLTEVGCRVEVSDRLGRPLTPELVGAAQVLLLAVPISQVEAVMARAGPHTDPRGLVMDVASLKAAPLASMLRHGRGEVLGCHPLFGPWDGAARGQAVFLCPGRGERWTSWARAFWRGLGARVKDMEPQAHDRLMAQVQSLRHLLMACLGRVLAESGFNPQGDQALAGPWFGRLWEVLANQARQPASLYAELALANPWGREVADSLAREAALLSEALRLGDAPGLAARLGVVEEVAGGE